MTLFVEQAALGPGQVLSFILTVYRDYFFILFFYLLYLSEVCKVLGDFFITNPRLFLLF